MSKFVIVGAIIGISIGAAAYFIFPQILSSELLYNQQARQSLGYPSNYYSPKGGGIYTVGVLFPLLAGIIGGILGLVVFKIFKSK